MLAQLVIAYHVEIASILALGSILYYLILYPFCLSPLKDIPGPYIYRISSIPSLNLQRKHQWVGTVHGLHKKYGDVVVTSPYSISCNSSQYVQDIYVKNMPKSTFYANFENHGQPNIFASLENKKHLQYKKLIVGLYNKSSVFANSKDLLIEKVSDLLSCVELNSVTGKEPDYINATSKWNPEGKGFGYGGGWLQKTTNVGIDVYSLFSALAMDVVSSFELGRGNGSNFLLSQHDRYMIMKHRMVSGMVFWTTLMPKFWSWAASLEIAEAAEEVEEWQLKMYKAAEIALTEEGNTEKDSCTLHLLNSCGLTGEAAYSLLSDNIFAGHETTAIQLTYLTYQLSRPANKNIQYKLINELHAAFGTCSIIDNLEAVDKLPFLDALIQETLRLHAAIPGAEPRVVDKPFKVMVNDSKAVIVPSGTTVSCQPYSLHRTSIFTEPDEFIPERWIKYEGETQEQYNSRIKYQNRYMMAFGKGIRMCLGMNLALIEMKLAVANLYLKYNSKVSSEWCSVANDLKKIELGMKSDGDKDYEKMTMFDSYTTRPWTDECWLEWYENEKQMA